MHQNVVTSRTADFGISGFLAIQNIRTRTITMRIIPTVIMLGAAGIGGVGGVVVVVVVGVGDGAAGVVVVVAAGTAAAFAAIANTESPLNSD